MKTIILGGGLAGISASYFIGHKNCIVYEKNSYLGGHIFSEQVNGFTWDEGPHVSFTEHEDVRKLLTDNAHGEILEYPVTTTNFYKGIWIPHPAQCNLYAIPKELRDQCIEDFKQSREEQERVPNNYAEWLNLAFGNSFSINFPYAYTKKYWTLDANKLSLDWVGERIFKPNINHVLDGAIKPLQEQTHYIKKVRYPDKGGFQSFSNGLEKGINVKHNHEVSSIDLNTKKIEFKNGDSVKFTKLINTLPLPIFNNLCFNSKTKEKQLSKDLSCSSVLLINVMASHKTQRSENWIYVYDEDKYSTRINCTELLSPKNAPKNKSGIQVEVYFSKYRPYDESKLNEIKEKVCKELIEMGLLLSQEHIEQVFCKFITFANVIFDKKRLNAQNAIFENLEKYGLARELDDLLPSTNWKTKFEKPQIFGDIILAGRYGQWKYFWTDDCILRGKYIAQNLNN